MTHPKRAAIRFRINLRQLFFLTSKEGFLKLKRKRRGEAKMPLSQRQVCLVSEKSCNPLPIFRKASNNPLKNEATTSKKKKISKRVRKSRYMPEKTHHIYINRCHHLSSLSPFKTGCGQRRWIVSHPQWEPDFPSSTLDTHPSLA